MYFRKRPLVVKAITFDEFVKYGKENSGHMYDGIPVMFNYCGHPVYHADNKCYIIPTVNGTLRFTSADVLVTGIMGEIYPVKKYIFDETYEHIEDPDQTGSGDEKEFTWGFCTAIDLSRCPVEKITDGERIKNYVDILCKNFLKVNKHGETLLVNFGKDPIIKGFSMAQLIETSLVSGHFADNLNGAFIDIFSCAAYNMQDIVDFTEAFFGAERSSHTFYLRKVWLNKGHEIWKKGE